jgi:hypothetical protein
MPIVARQFRSLFSAPSIIEPRSRIGAALLQRIGVLQDAESDCAATLSSDGAFR